MEALQIIANSWPFAVAFVALCVAATLWRLIAYFRKSDQEDRAYKADAAKTVTTVARREY